MAAKRVEVSPYQLLDAKQLAEIVCVSQNWLTAARKAGAPFPLGRSRPEWIHEWMRANADLQLKEIEQPLRGRAGE